MQFLSLLAQDFSLFPRGVYMHSMCWNKSNERWKIDAQYETWRFNNYLVRTSNWTRLIRKCLNKNRQLSTQRYHFLLFFLYCFDPEIIMLTNEIKSSTFIFKSLSLSVPHLADRDQRCHRKAIYSIKHENSLLLVII